MATPRRLASLVTAALLGAALSASRADAYLRDATWFSPRESTWEAASSKSVCFLTMGDWGDERELRKYDVPRILNEESRGCAFVALLGDNFYNVGVKSVTDPRFKSTYEDVLVGDSLDKLKFLVLAGNHDYYGNVTAQVAYKDPTKRWTFPSLYYARGYEKNGIKILMVMLDTWELNGGDTLLFKDAAGTTWLSSEEALAEAVATGHLTPSAASNMRARFPVWNKLEKPKPSDRKPDEVQYAWLEKVLASKAAAESDWVFVAGHFPVHSATYREHGDTPYLVERLVPLFKKYRVDAYFFGHDHVLQHVQKTYADSKRTVAYIGSGAGAKHHEGMRTLYPGLKGSATGTVGFMKHVVTKSSFTTEFVTSPSGTKVKPYKFSLTRVPGSTLNRLDILPADGKTTATGDAQDAAE